MPFFGADAGSARVHAIAADAGALRAVILGSLPPVHAAGLFLLDLYGEERREELVPFQGRTRRQKPVVTVL